MSFWEILLISLGLAMDAFAVAICKGIAANQKTPFALKLACFFGFFQAFMPLFGFFLGKTLEGWVATYSKLLSSAFLILIGWHMVREAPKNNKGNHSNLTFSHIFLLSIATSLDAFSVGIALAFTPTNIIHTSAIIGVITFWLSFLGVKIGKYVGIRLQTKAPLLGGILLFLLGIKNLF